MRNLCFILLVLPAIASHAQPIASRAYSWQPPVNKTGDQSWQATIFEGEAHDMEFIRMTSNLIMPSPKGTSAQVPANEEQLLLLKSGQMIFTMNDSSWTLGTGSVVLLMPSQRYSIRNATRDSCAFFMLSYRSIESMNSKRGKDAGGSLVKDWNKTTFNPHDKGGIRRYFERPTAMCKRLEMHVTTLKEGLKSHDPHRHAAEEIVLVISNQTEMQIDEHFYKGGPGTLYYLGSNVAHAIRNDGKGECVYFAFQFN